MMKNNIAIGIVVAVAVGVVITGSTLTAVSAQGNVTAGDIKQKLMTAAAKAKALGAVINNKDVYVVACDPSFTDPGTQCEVYNVAKEPHR